MRTTSEMYSNTNQISNTLGGLNGSSYYGMWSILWFGKNVDKVLKKDKYENLVF